MQQPIRYINLNGKIIREDQCSISPNNRSFRYGDGCFETMKMIQGTVQFSAYHFERLFHTLELLQFECPKDFTPELLKQQIETLAKKNYHHKLGRIRLMAFRGDGGIYDVVSPKPNFLIQTWPINEANNSLNENGLIIDIYKDTIKSCDRFSNLKTNNYLGYAMAALWAKKNHLNDALVLNSHARIADATIANVFIIKAGQVVTPSMAEGCVNGIMRRHLVATLPTINIPIQEGALTVEAILSADEVFLTNSIYGIRWVKSIQSVTYQNTLTTTIFKKLIQPQWILK